MCLGLIWACSTEEYARRIIEKLNREIGAVLADTKVKSRLTDLGRNGCR